MKKLKIGNVFYSGNYKKVVNLVYTNETTGTIGAVSINCDGRITNDCIVVKDLRANINVVVRPYIFNNDEFKNNFLNLCAIKTSGGHKIKPCAVNEDVVKIEIASSESVVCVLQSPDKKNELEKQGYIGNNITWQGQLLYTYVKLE